MKEELRAIEKNKTCKLVQSSRKREVGVKWVYKLKLRLNGDISRYKARMVCIGFLQKPSIDFDEVYVLVARLGH